MRREKGNNGNFKEGRTRFRISSISMGGHGGLNILPQKSWNVYGRKQRERVRRDEEQWEREQKEEAEKKEEEERAKRLRALRGEKEEGGEEKEIGRESLTNKHVNFFENHEKALESLEKKQKAKKSEEDEGNRLGGSGSHLKQPWYAKSTTSFYDDDDDDDDDEDKKYGRRHYSLPKRVRMQREETERLRLADKNNAKTNAKEQPFENRPTLTKVMLTDGYVPPSERKRKQKKKKKKKKEKKKKRRRSSSSDDDSGDEKEHELARALKMQKLREERARREMKERERAKSVFTNASKNMFA